jgi:hypothetical protein
LKAY